MFNAAAYLIDLNRKQREAVQHGVEEPLLIIAGAGSGKTKMRAHRVAHLIVNGTDPRHSRLFVKVRVGLRN